MIKIIIIRLLVHLNIIGKTASREILDQYPSRRKKTAIGE